MRHELRTQIAVRFATIVLVTVAAISLAANFLIGRQFEKYVEQQQKEFSKELAESLAYQYDRQKNQWNEDYIHGMGMYVLNDGYIIRVYDKERNVVWDAENHDMTLCHQVMDGIAQRMQQVRPELNGEFVTDQYELTQGKETVGYLEIGYYSPFYYDENDFHFLYALNIILLVVGVAAIAGAATAGILLARNISEPIILTTHIAGEIAQGNYEIRFKEPVKSIELKELTEAVNHMAKTLEEQETMRKQLTTDVAHELRTPLSNVATHLEAMVEGIWEPTPERLSGCYEEIERLTKLVADLERLRQVESDNLKIHKTEIDLQELSQRIMANFEAVLKDKRLICQIEGVPVTVQADENRMLQVITNLLSNAIKYSNPAGHIWIRTEEAGESARLVVEDEGIGISKADLPHIFERFYRTDKSRSRKTGGAGIGLTVVKSIVQAHGGSVLVESQEGKGSRFIIEIPKRDIYT